MPSRHMPRGLKGPEPLSEVSVNFSYCKVIELQENVQNGNKNNEKETKNNYKDTQNDWNVT